MPVFDWHLFFVSSEALACPDGVKERKTVEPGGHFDYTDARHVRPLLFIRYSRTSMALKATIFKAQISLSDMDRNLYQDFSSPWPVTPPRPTSA
jgi:hypothetical protein